MRNDCSQRRDCRRRVRQPDRCPAARHCGGDHAGDHRTHQRDALDRGFAVSSSRWCGAPPQTGAGDIYLAVSRDGGRQFDAPVRVNAVAGEARISGEIAPRVSLAGGIDANTPEIAVLWNAKRRRHRDPPGALARWRTDLCGRAHAAGARRGGRSRLGGDGARCHGRARTRSGSIIAAWPQAAGARGHNGEHDGVAMAQTVRAVLREGVRHGRARTIAVPRRLLLLQDRNGDRARRCDRHRVASRFRRELPRHGLLRIT